MADDAVLVTADGPVRVLTLNRPGSLNAFELASAFQMFVTLPLLNPEKPNSFFERV